MTIEGSFTRSGSRVPPHSREAEESVLGAVLLSIDAANEVMDRLAGDDFYVPAHQSIYEAMRRLYDANQAIDAVTLSEELRRAGELEKVGGVSYLTRLVDVVPVTSNVEHYAAIVEESGRRRDLIRAGGTVTSIAFDLDDEIHSVMDRAEQTVLGVAEKRASQSLLEIGPLFSDVLEQIELLEQQGSEITGLATGFRDLDKKLAGLQNANLVIIAARPAMGKCLAGGTLLTDAKTGERFTIRELVEDEDRHGVVHLHALDADTLKTIVVTPSDFLSQGRKETLRVTTRLGHQIEATSNHPFLTLHGWRTLDQMRIGDAVAVPRSVGAFGVDIVSDAEVAVLGYLIGDGTVKGTTPRFTTASERIRDDLARYVAALGAELRSKPGIEFSIVGAGRPSQVQVAAIANVSAATVNLVVNGRPGPSEATRDLVFAAADEVGYSSDRVFNCVREMLEKHGLWGCGAADKFVPDQVFRLGPQQVALFLNRLYATDGSAWVSGNYYRIEYSTISQRLAIDVQHLLLRFGIQAKLRRRKIAYGGVLREAFDVSFQDPASVERFARSIGIFSKEEQVERVRTMAAGRGVKQRATDRIPPAVWVDVLRAKGELAWRDISNWTGRSANHNWHVNRRGVSRRLLQELGQALSSARLNALATSDVTWDPIVAVEPAGLQDTYDLTIPLHHNFVANDIVVHNSALMLNIATNAASQGKPIALFSLEMSKEELVQRILSSVGRVDSMKLRSGQLGPLWQRVVDAASRMYKAPIFIDDSPVVTVTDIRAKCRRLKRKSGLSLVVVDYLQLMQGSNRENRQQEIAEISRNLKNLARELDVPVVGLSQLNRSLEAREDKRPRLSDLRESGCMPASTRLLRADTGAEVTLGELVLTQEQPLVWSVDDNWRLVPRRLLKTFPSGVKHAYRLRTAAGYEVEATANHRFLTVGGWTRLDELEAGSHVAVPRRERAPVDGVDRWDSDELVLLAHLLGDGSIGPTVRYATSDPANKEVVELAAKRRFGVSTNAQLQGRTWQMHLASPYRLTHGRHHPIRNWLEPMGLWGSRSHDKFVPAEIFGLSDDQVALFLHHLWATDGSITLTRNGRGPLVRIYYATTSRRLAEDVRRLLLRLDIRARIATARKTGYRDSYHVRISGRDELVRFLHLIGSHGSRGAVVPEAREILEHIKPNPNVDLVPWEVASQVKEAAAAASITHRQLAAALGEGYPGAHLLGTAQRPRRFSRGRLHRMGNIVGDQKLVDLATSDVFWDQIVEITPIGEVPTFDATVEDTHNFVANGIFAHNSLEQDADVVMFIYRHEYYHPEDQENKGLAEVIIAKHRAGSTGTVRMTFLPEFTRFADLGRDVT